MALRVCRSCGLEAKTETELDLFVTNFPSRYGHSNLCKRCASTYLKQWASTKHGKIIRDQNTRKQAPRKLRFKDKIIRVLTPPRKNVCELCGKKYPEELKSQTHIHHEEYDPDNPLIHTKELCRSCHAKVHGFGILIRPRSVPK
jgi:hypothetical protein